MLGYLSTDVICSEKQTVFWECSSKKTVSYKEQIMSKDKYLSIFSPQMEAIVFIILQIFFTTCALLKIGEYINNSLHLARKMLGYLSTDNVCSRGEQLNCEIFPSFSCRIFSHVTHLDQLHARKNICWIIRSDFIHELYYHICNTKYSN